MSATELIELAKQAGLTFISTTSAGELLGGNTIAHERILKFGELVAARAAARDLQPAAPSELHIFLLNQIGGNVRDNRRVEHLNLAHNDVWVLRQLITEATAREQLLINLIEHLLHNSAAPYSAEAELDKDFQRRYNLAAAPLLALVKAHRAGKPVTPVYNVNEVNAAITSLFKYTNLHQDAIDAMRAILLANLGSAA